AELQAPPLSCPRPRPTQGPAFTTPSTPPLSRERLIVGLALATPPAPTANGRRRLRPGGFPLPARLVAGHAPGHAPHLNRQRPQALEARLTFLKRRELHFAARWDFRLCSLLVEIKEAGGTITSSNPEEATFQNALTQDSCCKFPSSQEPEDTSSCSLKKESNPMVICQLKGGTQMLCIDNSGTRELKALHLVPQYQDQNNYLQSDVPKPMTALVGRFLPVPAKLNLITQQFDNGALPSVVNGSAFPSGSTLPGPSKITLAGYCDCFASGDFCSNCNCNNCCNNLRHEIERFKAIKACLDRNPEAFQPKIGKGKLGDVKPRHNKGCNCKRSGCLKNYCECFEAKIMCSSICKCIGCKNYEESPERKIQMNMLSSVETGGFEGSHPSPPAEFSGLAKFRKDRRPTSCISWEVVEATCACLLAQGEEAEKEHCSQCLAEQIILEEFGRCLSQILHIEFKSKGLKIE
ncbi:tesmin, partial [Carlito syrichta]|uniref:Tesmin n=1 Tax=Carlito syrichta TaxID=1868482 RepID=A0A3Q0DH11_CARSF